MLALQELLCDVIELYVGEGQSRWASFSSSCCCLPCVTATSFLPVLFKRRRSKYFPWDAPIRESSQNQPRHVSCHRVNWAINMPGHFPDSSAVSVRTGRSRTALWFAALHSCMLCLLICNLHPFFIHVCVVLLLHFFKGGTFQWVLCS